MARTGLLRARYFVALDGTVVERAAKLTEDEKCEIFRRDRFVCQYCGMPVIQAHIPPSNKTLRRAHVDHIVPQSRGGQNTPDNLVTACSRCNTHKGADRTMERIDPPAPRGMSMTHSSWVAYAKQRRLLMESSRRFASSHSSHTTPALVPLEGVK